MAKLHDGAVILLDTWRMSLAEEVVKLADLDELELYARLGEELYGESREILPAWIALANASVHGRHGPNNFRAVVLTQRPSGQPRGRRKHQSQRAVGRREEPKWRSVTSLA